MGRAFDGHHGFRPVDRCLAHQADLACFFRREAALDDLGSHRFGSRGVDTAEVLATRHRQREDGFELLDQEVVVELRHRLALQRFGVRRQQLAEELLLRCLRPADQLHAFVEVPHERRQLHEELLAERRRALGLHAHHEIGTDPAVAPAAVGIGAVAPAGQHQGLAPDLRQEVVQVGRHVERAEGRAQLQHVALLDAELGFLGLEGADGASLLDLAFGLVGDEVLEVGNLRRVELDLVEIAFDDLVDQLAHPGQELRAGAVFELVEGAGQGAECG